MGMWCSIDQIGTLVIGCSVALDGEWMFLLIMLVCWLFDVLLPSMVNGCSYSSCWHVGYWMFCRPWWSLDVLLTLVVIGCSAGHDGYWMSYWHWWFLDNLFIVVIGRFDKHKQKKRLRTKLYDKTADLNVPIGTLHLYVTTFLLHLHLEYNY